MQKDENVHITLYMLRITFVREKTKTAGYVIAVVFYYRNV